MSDDVNSQHIQSMGLDPSVLGTTIPTGPSRFGCQACQKEKHAECWTMVEIEQVGPMADKEDYAAMGRPCRCYTASETKHEQAREHLLRPEEEKVDGRCSSWGPLGRCAGMTGHETRHFRGKSVWDDDAPVPTKQREGDQVLPTGDPDQRDVQAMVIDDIHKRLQVGIERYGQGLKPFNGRKTLLDAYEESLDQTVYLRSLLAMQEANREHLIEVVQAKYYDAYPDGEVDGQDVAEIAVNAILDAFAGPR